VLFAGAVFTMGAVGTTPNNTICKYHPEQKNIIFEYQDSCETFKLVFEILSKLLREREATQLRDTRDM
jgi:hypothetical protein